MRSANSYICTIGWDKLFRPSLLPSICCLRPRPLYSARNSHTLRFDLNLVLNCYTLALNDKPTCSVSTTRFFIHLSYSIVTWASFLGGRPLGLASIRACPVPSLSTLLTIFSVVSSLLATAAIDLQGSLYSSSGSKANASYDGSLAPRASRTSSMWGSRFCFFAIYIR